MLQRDKEESAFWRGLDGTKEIAYNPYTGERADKKDENSSNRVVVPATDSVPERQFAGRRISLTKLINGSQLAGFEKEAMKAEEEKRRAADEAAASLIDATYEQEDVEEAGEEEEVAESVAESDIMKE
jgi:hypothetical protein